MPTKGNDYISVISVGEGVVLAWFTQVVPLIVGIRDLPSFKALFL